MTTVMNTTINKSRHHLLHDMNQVQYDTTCQRSTSPIHLNRQLAIREDSRSPGVQPRESIENYDGREEATDGGNGSTTCLSACSRLCGLKSRGHHSKYRFNNDWPTEREKRGKEEAIP